MATLTKITKRRRNQRRKKAGRDRKARVAANGTTPKFAVHTSEADQNAPEQVSPKKG